MAWSDILGQELAKRILQSHLARRRVPNAYLLAGPDGVGKRRLALEMAKALNCSAVEGRPCDACRPCAQIGRGVHPDVHAVIRGGASDQIKIDQIRHIIGRVALRPFSAAYQVVIIEAAERLTEEAGNSLLKVLEEPSSSTSFLLTTAHLGGCLPTIVSRCHLIRCQPLSADAVRRILTQTHGVEPKTAEAVARLSSGSAVQAIDLAGRWAAYQQMVARLTGDAQASWLDASAPATRQDVAQLLDGMVAWLRDVAVSAAGGSQWITHAEHADALRRQAERIDVDRCLETAAELMRLRESADQFVSPRLIASLAREKWLSLVISEK